MLLVNLGGSIISWTSIVIPILSVTTCLAATLFYFHEVRFPLPVLPLHLLNSRHMASQVGLNLFGAMTVFGTLFLIPVYFQTVLLTTASIASRRLLYPTLTAPLGSICTGLCLHRWHDGHRWFQRVGSAVLLAGATTMFYMTFEQDHGRSELWYICRLVWVHLGMGMLFISSLLDILTRAGAGMCSHIASLAGLTDPRTRGSLISHLPYSFCRYRVGHSWITIRLAKCAPRAFTTRRDWTRCRTHHQRSSRLGRVRQTAQTRTASGGDWLLPLILPRVIGSSHRCRGSRGRECAVRSAFA